MNFVPMVPIIDLCAGALPIVLKTIQCPTLIWISMEHYDRSYRHVASQYRDFMSLRNDFIERLVKSN